MADRLKIPKGRKGNPTMPNTEKANTIEYRVLKMRAVPVTGKIAERNPDYLFTVHGEFHTVTDGKVAKEALTIGSKVIDRETAQNPLFSIDANAGILILPAGERGRKAKEGVDQSAIDAMLAAVRNPQPEAQPEPEPEPEATAK